MSSLKKRIDYKMLEAELDEAIREDELYKLRNDAKFRALEQRVPTYDDFKNMVDGAHLRPLERKEMQKKAQVSWNHCWDNKNEESIIQTHYYQSNSVFSKPKDSDDCSKNTVEPKTSMEFIKFWKLLPDSKSKFQYLLKYRHCFGEKFFKVEVPSEIFHKFFKIAAEICSADTVSSIAEILQIFSKCNRFSLSLAMVTAEEKKCMQLLFENMLGSAQNDVEAESVNELLKLYCTPLDENNEENQLN